MWLTIQTAGWQPLQDSPGYWRLEWVRLRGGEGGQAPLRPEGRVFESLQRQVDIFQEISLKYVYLLNLCCCQDNFTFVRCKNELYPFAFIYITRKKPFQL